MMNSSPTATLGYAHEAQASWDCACAECILTF